MIPAALSRVVVIIFGVCYPAYSTFKAIRTKKLREYVTWMMYWAVFTPFLCAEPFAESMFSWMPFYYDLRAVGVLWLASPTTKGAVYLYKRYLHPAFRSREREIDEYITLINQQTRLAVIGLCSHAVAFATELIRKAAQNSPDNPFGQPGTSGTSARPIKYDPTSNEEIEEIEEEVSERMVLDPGSGDIDLDSSTTENDLFRAVEEVRKSPKKRRTKSSIEDNPDNSEY